MKLQFFSVDALEPDSDQDVIDDFCTRHRLVSVDKRFVERGDFCYWSVCVTYLEPSSSSSKPTKAVDKRGQVDYREILVAEDFAIYAKLRDLRKTISEAENAPVYAIFSNAQMADMVTNRATSLTALGEVFA
ncbi:HRDC domain-containing protein [Thiothrix litoralis]|jgi:superfamily II DNA helicase RecQ|uniref:HRDC domain-containing protein n=1 Tax=Thiothrix litoralis TaxID=2891210 RepID=A0ABX7WUB8_9GAMM|nr:HRDC domain-containing protein [Thiothrix litoralis]QTR46861.1 HRDC domain-containing protein [Thiothrix litoralis]